MKRYRIAWVALLTLLSAGVGRMSANPITFVFDTQVRGTLDGVAFPYTLVRVTAQANTEDLRDDGGGLLWIWSTGPAELELAGMGIFEVIPQLRTYHADNTMMASVGLETHEGNFLVGTQTTELVGWDMASNIGPIHVRSAWSPMPIETTGGVLIPDSIPRLPLTFTAAIVPEPATAALVTLAGLLAVKALRRR